MRWRDRDTRVEDALRGDESIKGRVEEEQEKNKGLGVKRTRELSGIQLNNSEGQ